MKKSVLVILCLFLFQLSLPFLLSADTVIKVGVYENPPKVLIDRDGKPKGLFIDVLQYIASKEKWRIQYVPGTWVQCLQRLERGEIDLMVDVGYSEERAKRFDFSDEPVLSSWARLYTREDSEIKSLLDLRDKKIAVMKGALNSIEIKTVLKRMGIVSHFVEVKDYYEVFRLLRATEADAGLVTGIFGLQWERKYDVVRSPIILCAATLHFAVLKNQNRSLIKAIDDHMVALKRDKRSIYYHAYGRWIESLIPWQFPRWLMYVLVFSGIFMAWLIVHWAILKKAVKAKTAQLSITNEELQNEIMIRKQTEEDLQAEKSFIETTCNTLTDVLFVFDLQGRMLKWNRAGTRILGYSEEEVSAMKATDFFSEEDVPRVLETIQSVISDEYSIVEAPFRTKDGRLIPYELTGALLRDDENNPIGVCGIGRDIQERIMAEEKVRHLNSTLNAIRKVNQLIVKERDCKRLLKGACDHLIKTRDCHNAWIALIDESGEFVTTAEAGLGKEFLPLQRLLERGELVNCARRVLSESGVIYIKDPSTACAYCPLAKESHARGAMAVRLEQGGRTYGILSISIPKDLVRDKEELSLFEEVAGDISFGLHNIELRKMKEKSEEELRHERDFMARIMETSPVCITMVNREGQITFANPGAEEVLGLSPDEVTRRTYNSPEWRITDYDGKPFPNEHLPFRRVMDAGQPIFNVSHAIEWPDGRRVLLSINGAPLFDNVGQIEGVLCAIQDVTEQMKTEEALKKSETRYRALVEQIPAITYTAALDEASTTLYVSPQIEAILGLSPEEYKNDPDFWQKHLHPEDLESVFAEIARTHETGQPFAMEYRMTAKDGHEVCLRDEARIIKDEHGSPLCLQGIMVDITESKRAEERIKEYSENLEKMVGERTKELNRALYDAEEARDRIDGILKSVGDGLIVTDLYNRVILMNRAAEDLLGVRLSEVIDRPIDFAIEDTTLRNRIKTTLDKRESGYQFDFELPGDDLSNPRIIRGRTSIIEDKAGKHTGIITTMNDVTYEREVDRMKTEFISTAAHELRTPLTSIQGFSELLTTRDDITEEEKEECLFYINTQSINLANIINDLLDVSRIESGKGFSLDKAPCNIAELIRETVPSFQVHSKKHHFDLALPDEPLEAIVDKDKIRQVLENILSNAVKYSPEGGTIRITGNVVEDHYQVSIEDQGIGMTPEQVEKIFDKFYRADASNTAIPGTGLGMSIVKYLVEAHGGEVWVESPSTELGTGEVGKGTTVRFTIPIT